MVVHFFLFMLPWCHHSYPSSVSHNSPLSNPGLPSVFPTQNKQLLPYILAGTTATGITAALIWFYGKRKIVEDIRQRYANYILTLDTDLNPELKMAALLPDIFGETARKKCTQSTGCAGPKEYYEDLALKQQISVDYTPLPLPTSYPVVDFVQTLDIDILNLKKMQSTLLSSLGIFWFFGLSKDINTTLRSLEELSKNLKASKEYANEQRLMQATSETSKLNILMNIVREYEKSPVIYQSFQSKK